MLRKEGQKAKTSKTMRASPSASRWRRSSCWSFWCPGRYSSDRRLHRQVLHFHGRRERRYDLAGSRGRHLRRDFSLLLPAHRDGHVHARAGRNRRPQSRLETSPALSFVLACALAGVVFSVYSRTASGRWLPMRRRFSQTTLCRGASFPDLHRLFDAGGSTFLHRILEPSVDVHRSAPILNRAGLHD